LARGIAQKTTAPVIFVAFIRPAEAKSGFFGHRVKNCKKNINF